MVKFVKPPITMCAVIFDATPRHRTVCTMVFGAWWIRIMRVNVTYFSNWFICQFVRIAPAKWIESSVVFIKILLKKKQRPALPPEMQIYTDAKNKTIESTHLIGRSGCDSPMIWCEQYNCLRKIMNRWQNVDNWKCTKHGDLIPPKITAFFQHLIGHANAIHRSHQFLSTSQIWFGLISLVFQLRFYDLNVFLFNICSAFLKTFLRLLFANFKRNSSCESERTLSINVNAFA